MKRPAAERMRPRTTCQPRVVKVKRADEEVPSWTSPASRKSSSLLKSKL